MRWIFKGFNTLLRQTPLAEPLRRIKQRLKRRLERRPAEAEFVVARPLFAYGPAALAEVFKTASGPDGRLTASILPGDRPEHPARLSLAYGIQSLDFSANWLQLEFTDPGLDGLDLRDCDAIALQLDASGDGGQLLLSLTDESTGTICINRPDLLYSAGPSLAIFDFRHGFRPPWKDDPGTPFIPRRIRRMDISIRPGDHSLPLQGKLRLDGILALRRRDTVVHLEPRIRDARMVDDFSRGVEERLQISHGPSSRLTVSLDPDHPFQGRPALKLDFHRSRVDPRRDWLTVLADLHPPAALDATAGVMLYLCPDGGGGVLRVVLRDGSGRERIHNETHVLGYSGWRKLYLPLSVFSPPDWRGGDGQPLENIETVSLSLLPAAGQNRGALHLGGWFIAGRADFPVVAGEGSVAHALVEDLLIRCGEEPPGGASTTDAVPEPDDSGTVLVLPPNPDGEILHWEITHGPRRLTVGRSLALRLADPGVLPRVELLTPAGDVYRAVAAGTAPMGREHLAVYPLDSFQRQPGGVRFTESARAQGFIRGLRLIFPPHPQGLPLRLRHVLLLGNSDLELTEPSSAAAELPAESAGPARRVIPETVFPSRVPAPVNLDPHHLKELDDRSGGEFGLCRIALFVEPTNLCNLRCIMCNHGDHSFRRGLGVMKFKDFRRMTGEIREEKLKFWEFAPFWLGEPFIHPQIRDFLEEGNILKRDFHSMQHYNIHTNGVNLSEAHLRMIADSQLSSILFSVDAATPETYSAIRRGGNLESVVAAVERLLALRRERGRPGPAVIVQLIVMDENVHEVKEFREFWRARGIRKTIFAGCPADNPFSDVEPDVHLLFPQTPEDAIFIKALEPNALTKGQQHREVLPAGDCNPPWRFACASLFRMLSVAWDGSATACCRDDQMDMSIGNVLQEGIVNVWYGEKLRELRLKHITGDLAGVPKCHDCYNWVKNPLEISELLHWLRSIGREDLAGPYLARVRKQD